MPADGDRRWRRCWLVSWPKAGGIGALAEFLPERPQLQKMRNTTNVNVNGYQPIGMQKMKLVDLDVTRKTQQEEKKDTFNTGSRLRRLPHISASNIIIHIYIYRKRFAYNIIIIYTHRGISFYANCLTIKGQVLDQESTKDRRSVGEADESPTSMADMRTKALLFQS